MSRIEEAITEYYGPRCKPPLDDPEAKCECCEAWKEYDDLAANATAFLQLMKSLKSTDDDKDFAVHRVF